MIPRFSCHIFRHTFSSRFCENETNVKVIQEVMGHADVSTTMNIYAEANSEVTKEALEKHVKGYRHQLSDMTFDFNMDHDMDIKPIAKSGEHYQKWVENYPFYANVNRDGVTLYAA